MWPLLFWLVRTCSDLFVMSSGLTKVRRFANVRASRYARLWTGVRTIYRDTFERYDDELVLVDFSPRLNLGDFHCKDEDYREWLIHDAPQYVRTNLTRVKCLVNPLTDRILGYMALCADSFLITKTERNRISKRLKVQIPFQSLPALKVGKLATHVEEAGKSYGVYLLWLAIAIAKEMMVLGVACRFLTVDADISVDPTIVDYYTKHGFVLNQHGVYDERQQCRSMRYDLFRG